MWDAGNVRDAGYSGCEKFQDVGCSRCGMLIYKMPN